MIPAENLDLIMLENVLRLFNAESSTSTSLYQHWLAAKGEGKSVMNYAGHELAVSELEPNGRLPYLMDTPSTKEKVDRTIDAAYLIENGVCTSGQYAQLRNASLMAFGMVTQYLAETREELQKVVWPTRDEAVNLTIVVLFVTALMTVLLGGIDLVFTELLDIVLSLFGV